MKHLIALIVAGLLGMSFAAHARGVTTTLGQWEARFDGATSRYGHAIMGNLPEWGRLCLNGPEAQACVTLQQMAVFEDIAPRLHDLDGDTIPEAIVVESTMTAGAALVVYRMAGGSLERIATPHIGTRNRWLAPAGIADLDGDGAIEIAFVDRPHLAKRLRVWRFENNQLTHVADMNGVSNHRIGETYITGGLRDCGEGPEIITASANWSDIVSTRLEGGALQATDLGPFSSARLRDVLACQ